MSALVKALAPLKPLKKILPTHVTNFGHRLITDLQIDPAPFHGFSNKDLMLKIAQTRFLRQDEQFTQKTKMMGWLTAKERQILYALGRWAPGPITEIGSWCGLSTTAIARGIKDSGETKTFRTFDFVLTPEMYHPLPDGTWETKIGGKTIGIVSAGDWANGIKPVISQPGGSNGMLKRNLAHLGFSDMVEIFTGDFRQATPVKSNSLFCDCLHNADEIEMNADYLRQWLNPGCVLFIHDLGGMPELVPMLREHLPIGHGVTVDTMYVTEVI